MHLIDGRVKSISSHGGINLERGGRNEGGRGTKTRSGLFSRRAATGGEEKPEWHADLVPGP